jgi:hypothetical protein
LPQYLAGINRLVGKDVVQRITFVPADSKKSSNKE